MSPVDRPNDPPVPSDLPSDPNASFDPTRTHIPRLIEYASTLDDPPATELDRSLDPGATLSIGSGEAPIASAPDAPGSDFEFRRILGEGGFGEVWEARQGTLSRVVAVKRLRSELLRAMDRAPGGRARTISQFRQEALTTGALEHPNIVPVHDFRQDETGSPMLGMKLVRGQPWHRVIGEDFCLVEDEYYMRHLPILVAVGQAVAFAHARGVIHRDLKPSQVMVGDFGEVLLMDWGLAVVVDEAAGREHCPELMASGAAPLLANAMNPAGTAAFMAPEQTDPTPQRLGTWTDVYLLGGILYALLTGSMPHSAPDAQAAFLEARIGEVEDPRTRARHRHIPDDLAELALATMRPEPSERLASALEFVRRIEAFLSGEGERRESAAIVARVEAALSEERYDGPAGESYAQLTTHSSELDRAQGLWPANPGLLRLRARVLESFARVALRNGDLVLARTQAVRLGDEDARAVLLGEIDQAEARQRAHARQRRVLFTATAALLAFATALAALAHREANRARTARDQAEDLAVFMMTDLQDRLESVGRLDLIGDVARKAERYYADASPEERTGERLVNESRTLVARGAYEEDAGNLAAAERAYRRALEVALQRRAEDPKDPDGRAAEARARYRLAEAISARDETDESLELHRQALELHRELATDRPKDPHALGDYARSLMVQGEILASTEDDFSAARVLFEEAAGLLARARKLAPANDTLVRTLADNATSLSTIDWYERKPEEALSRLAAAVDEMEVEYKRRPDSVTVGACLGDLLQTRSFLFQLAGRDSEAEAPMARAREVLEEMLARYPADSRRVDDLAAELLAESDMRRRTGRFDDAANLIQRALTLRRSAVARDANNMQARRDLGRSLQFASQVELNRQDLDASELLAREAVEQLDFVVSRAPDDRYSESERLVLVAQHADLLWRTKRYDECRAEVERELARGLEFLPRSPNQETTSEFLAQLFAIKGALLHREGNVDQAREALDRAWELMGPPQEFESAGGPALRTALALLRGEEGEWLEKGQQMAGDAPRTGLLGYALDVAEKAKSE